MDSILNSIKAAIGIAVDYTQFDDVLIMHINSVFSTLTQLGVGPSEGYSIHDANDTWDDFIQDRSLVECVRSYVYLKVKLIFDPPVNSFVVNSFEKSIEELEWRMNVAVETPAIGGE